jgi:hypothetical protein
VRRLALVGPIVACAIACAPRGSKDDPVVYTLPSGAGVIRQVFDAEGRLSSWSELEIADGRTWLHGVDLRFDESGEVRHERRYVHGRQHGTARVYHAGRIFDEREYEDGRPVGLVKRYSPDGSLHSVLRLEHGVQACAPLLRGPDDPPITEADLACLATEPTYWEGAGAVAMRGPDVTVTLATPPRD